MSRADDILEQADYLVLLAQKIRKAAEDFEPNTHKSGTISNLAPELSKAASKIRRMTRCDYD